MDQLLTNYDEQPCRLGLCEVCGKQNAKYTCPKCEVKTCCIGCVNIHKKELNCDGIRDRTKFISKEKFTNLDFLSDFRLLQECGRNVESWKKNKDKQYTRLDKELPMHLFRLRAAATTRGTILKFLSQNFEKHKQNTTFLNWSSNIIQWKVEWIFPNAENIKFVDELCDENEKLSKLLHKYIGADSEPFYKKESLMFYQSAGLNGIKILLKAEFVKNSKNKFHELDANDTLRRNLENKIVVEYPQIFIVLKDHSHIYDLVDTDDENQIEELRHKPKHMNSTTNNKNEKKKKKNRENKSLLFQNEYSESSSDSELEETMCKDKL